MYDDELKEEDILKLVHEGLMTVRLAADLLDCTMDEIQMKLWGEVLL